jgi:hypothetical protein
MGRHEEGLLALSASERGHNPVELLRDIRGTADVAEAIN